MEINLLSKYRTQLMGIAMILVGIFHSTFMFENIPVLNFIKFSGDIGVDIFFFVSGLGMYYAFTKNPGTKDFYIKRISRIIPAWLIINLIVQIYNAIITGFDIKWFVLNMTGLSFICTGSLYFWYVPAILIFYFITPLFVRIFRKNEKAALGCVALVWLVLVGISFIFHYAHFFIMIFRIPIYFAGFMFGKASFEKKKVMVSKMWIVYVIFALSIIPEVMIMKYNQTISYFRYDFKYILFFFTAISLCMVLCMIFEKTESKWKDCLMNRILCFIGACTLEIYLLHEFILARAVYFLNIAGINVHSFIVNFIINIVVFALATVIASLMEKFLSRMVKGVNVK